MADGDAKFAAATLSRLQKQQDAMQSLFSAVEQGIADLADPKRSESIERLLGAIEGGIADIVAAMEGRTDAAMVSIAQAITGLKATVTVNVPEQKPPNVNVNVNPTPITVEAIMPAVEMPAPVIHIMPAVQQQGAKWKMTLVGQYGAADKTMLIERTN